MSILGGIAGRIAGGPRRSTGPIQDTRFGASGREFLDDEFEMLPRGRFPRTLGQGVLGGGAVSDEILSTGFGTLGGAAQGYRQRRRSTSTSTIGSRSGGTFGGGSFGSVSTGFPTAVS